MRRWAFLLIPLHLEVGGEKAYFCPLVVKDTQDFCAPCLLPDPDDDLCALDFTCHFYMRRCVRKGSPLEFETDYDLLQNACPEKPDDRSTWWARCVEHNCVVGSKEVCPSLCANPDFPCYWVTNCKMSPGVVRECQRSCGDRPDLLQKANEKLWKRSGAEFETCEKAIESHTCKGGFGREVNHFCPELCDGNHCSERCTKIEPREEPRGKTGSCRNVVPDEMTCEEAVRIGFDCHCTCSEIYRPRGLAGQKNEIFDLEVTYFSADTFELHATGTQLSVKATDIRGTEARLKIVNEDDSCDDPPSKHVDGVACTGAGSEACQSYPDIATFYYQRWNAIRIDACGKFTICYCGARCGKGGKFSESGVITIQRDRGDGWTYEPKDNCWDGAPPFDYPGPLQGVEETAQVDTISAVFALCGLQDKWPTLATELARWLKHRSLNEPRPNADADIRMEERPNFTVEASGKIEQKTCEMRDLLITTHSKESHELIDSKLRDIKRSNRFEDTFFSNLEPKPVKLRVVLVVHGTPEETQKAIGVFEEQGELPANTSQNNDNGEDEDNFWATPGGITVIAIIAVVFGGTFLIIFIFICCVALRKRRDEYRNKTTPINYDAPTGDGEGDGSKEDGEGDGSKEDGEGDGSKEDGEGAEPSKPPLPKTRNPFKLCCRGCKEWCGIINSMWKSQKDALFGPRTYSLDDAPEKWKGSSDEVEEIPLNCPPFIGAMVRVGGLSAVEYNGLRGKVLAGPNEKERYTVEVVLKEYPREIKEMSLKTDNLLVVKINFVEPDNSKWRQPSPKGPASSKLNPKPKKPSKQKPTKPEPPSHPKSYRQK